MAYYLLISHEKINKQKLPTPLEITTDKLNQAAFSTTPFPFISHEKS